MGKIEELIEKLEKVRSRSINKDFEDGYNGGIRYALELAKEYKSSLPTQRTSKIDIDNLVEAVDELRFREPDEFNYDKPYVDGFNKACGEVVDILYSLPTQQDKVAVPPCVDKFLSVGNKSQKLACLVSCKYSILTCDMAEGELKQWLREISMDDLLNLANGYTVEKEQLYLIKCAEDRSSDDVYLEEALWRTKNRAWAESGGIYEAVWNPSKEQCITLNKEKAEHLASLVEGIAVPVEETT